ncbi:amidohydrolase [Paenibacillus beijingensis]|uniref:Amidohydrolase n=1 Tax=Paenibacillus beijingensis TaxID=1126833 RepID=A0A0D5NNQ8_9BACL|nr:amidohydrolase [Paenibacillus beijingensis]AJY76790.1 amidohydrolase [Paenibacillus beijingensis]
MEKQELYELWDYLNKHPEVSWKEVNTTKKLMAVFEKGGFKPIPFQNMTGFYVEIGEGKPVIGLRADMDALYQDVDGVMQANHSCGHDAHMTIVTGAMHRLKKLEDQFTGTVRAIFQPAEEVGNGAVRVADEGVVDDVDYLFGVHVRPVNELNYPSCAPGMQHGACVFVKGKINGEDHHGARPHEGVSAIEVGHAIVSHLQQIHTSPQVPATVKMTNIIAGTENLNIIPGKATFGLDIRAQTNDVIDEIMKRVNHILTSLSELYGVSIEFEFEGYNPAAVINPEAEAILQAGIVNVLGEELLKPRIITPGSEDFHFYTLKRPQIKATMLALGADVTPGLHHPKMTFQKQAIENGVNILVEACLEACRIKKNDV